MMTKRRHLPSGILIVWMSKDSKIHTKSIGLHPFLKDMMLAVDTGSELLLKQLDTMGVGGYILPAPMVTKGLSRTAAKIAYRKELSVATTDEEMFKLRAGQYKSRRSLGMVGMQEP